MPLGVAIRGERGRWLAKAEGRWIPVIHGTWRRGQTGYFDPMTGAKLDGKRHAEYIEALGRETLVILQKDKPGSFERAGYIGIFSFTDLRIEESGLVNPSLLSRYADPQN